VLKTLASLLQLIYPPSCLICSTAGFKICLTCKGKWQQDIKSGTLNNFPIYFTNFYNSDCAKIVLSAKENGNLIAQELLADSISKSLKFAIAKLNLNQEIGLVTIPSSPSSIRKRGLDHINILSKKVIASYISSEIKINNLPILKISKKIQDQSKLNKAQRLQNMSGAYQAIKPKSSTKNLIIVDDLITTGASIQEAVRALSEINLRPVAIITACAVGAHL
jgi:predicted amidophosphoribosyltransferase